MYEDAVGKADLLLMNKVLRDKVKAFESGEKYLRIKEQNRKAREADARTIRRLEKELADARGETKHVRELWYATCTDVMAECEKKLKEKDKRIAELEKELAVANARTEKEHAAKLEKIQEMYQAKTELEKEKEKNQALTARLGKNHTNSSKPSSSDPNHGKIPNGREETDRKPGGQPGHEHHPRKRHDPTETVEIPAPEEYLDMTRYKPTGTIIRKQLVIAHITTEVIEYTTPEFRNLKTGQRVHADFPEGVADDVNYDGTVKALAYMLNNECNVSIGKTRAFLNQASLGKISISCGMICNLSKQFSDKTEAERKAIFQELLNSPAMHADFTFGRVNGKQGAVIITATPDGTVLYQAREKKGDEGVKGSPLENYDGTVISDHESAIIKHGKRHQECLSHISRYMKGSMENEPGREWSTQMRAWISKSVHYWNQVDDGEEEYDLAKAMGLIAEYDRIVEKAKSEYEYEPPSAYYREGYNTFRRMYDEREKYVLFLIDPSVPPTNNLAERSGRRYKRKSAQVMSFRSEKGREYYCDGLSVMESMKSRNENLFEGISERFNRH